MVLIYTENKTPRLSYICNQLFRHVLGFEFHITDKKENFLNAEDAVPICYAKERIGNGLHIVPYGIMEEKGLHVQNPELSEWNGMPAFFCTQGGDLPFDLFSAAFYLISRYEEYTDKETDKHGRYKAENSLAFRSGFLERPIVDEWALALCAIIKERYPHEKCFLPKFVYIPTIDVDHIYAFLHKGPVVNGYKIMKEIFSGHFKRSLYVLKVLLRLERDPFFNFSRLRRMHESCSRNCLVFCHCGCRGKYDKRTFFPSLKYVMKKRELAKDLSLGLHPSYHAGLSPFRFKMEKWMMEKSTGDHVSSVRFHYLRFRLPESYEMLSQMNIREDWSMTYSNNPGFRAGTSFPFHFYNLRNERTYKLMIHPTALMDKTLKSNLGLSIDDSYAYILNMAHKVEAVNGNFVTIFHNDHLTDAFDEWKGWRHLYKRLLTHFYGEGYEDSSRNYQ